MRIDVAGLSDKGKVRDENQDHFLVVRAGRYAETIATSLPQGAIPQRSEDRGLLMMVADGMGGQAAGEVASRTVLVTLTHLVLNHPEWALRVDEKSAADILNRAVARYKALDAALAERMEADPTLKGMGTTLTVAYSLGLDVFIAHAGDSRAYLFHEGSVRQLTRDHTYVQRLVDAGRLSREAAAGHELRGALTNILGGGDRSVEVELHRLRIAAGDRLLLCSDGLTGTMNDEEIAGILGRSASAEESCRRLVDQALERGAPDNVTAIVARYELSEDR
ncbi:MAG TPA: protein phosphatase 2C domain-containing protein [Candidatus Polarisedimenticolia bacterium]|nr:protein phosphatase 2C domain-containing protein [Candidatus Polarisedimenticolia bacterium]